MALPPETEAEILRRHFADHWPAGTIATQLNLHRDSVTRVLTQAGLPTLNRIERPSAIDPYLPFIRETLTQFPRLRASRLYAMVKDRGYPPRRPPPVLGDFRCPAPWITLPLRLFHASVTAISRQRDRRFAASVTD